MDQQSVAERDALEVVKRLREAGFQAYFAGGCVRDRLMGVAPKDIDVATNATPDQVIATFRRTIPVGKAFGVVLVNQGNSSIEVATFRSDGRYLDGRRPESVTFSSLEEDVQRRDFTVNGMMYDPAEDRVIDLVGGREDLARRTIRAIGDPRDRFREDHLRMVRAVRFACKLDFAIEPATLEAVRELAPLVKTVSGERVRHEIERILATPRASLGIGFLWATNLLGELLPEAAPDMSAFDHGLATLMALAPTGLAPGLAALLCAAGPDRALEVSDRLRLSREERESLVWLVARQDAPARVFTGPVAAFKRLARAPDFPALLALYRARCLAGGESLDVHDRIAQQLARWGPDDLRPKLLVDGNDLRDMGLPPSREYARILTVLEDAQLEGRVRTRDEALEMMRALARG